MGTLSDYRSVDYFNLDELLTEEQRQVRRTVRAFVTEKILPIIADCYEQQKFPEELIPEMAELGFFGANLQGYGAAGIDNIAYGLMMQELERGDSGLRSMASVQGGLVMYPIYAFGSEEQKQKYLPAMAKAKMIGCFGLTEPEHGSDPAGMETTAVKDGKNYVLNGNKTWITNANVADVAIIWAKTDDQIRGFLVEKGTKGFSTAKIDGKFSMRASHTGEIYLNDCRVPKDNMLPSVEGLKGPLSCLNQARYGISWGVIGAAMACYDEALKYCLERKQFDKPIASYQLVQEKLVDMLTEITKAQLLSYRLGQLKDADTLLHTQVSMAKRNNCRMALDVSRMARDLLGGNGITLDYQAIRHMTNLETVYTYEGTDHIHTLVMGADITGIQAFR
ncbi:acyl-CoA dehydrogenase family protein [Candidatus Acetothermia bacterium]|nr:acyl-CoA dehydrogenase family protein [Candidatus Acetothermia bacterium]MBI3644120.1 acyl-CoA dehydrogenase family protein [Candidatus Acetothermia bacterium]